MLFNSHVFLLAFLPATLLVYFGLNHAGKNRAAKVALVIASLIFYGYNIPSYIPVILSSIVINYGVFVWMKRFPSIRKAILSLALVFNIALLGYFKYFDFLLVNLNLFLHQDFDLLHIALPLGISFFTFQQISFLIDSARGECNCDNFLDYTLFVTFFPQLVAGPIVSHDEMLPQFASDENKAFSFENMRLGLIALSIGLFKKVVVADSFGRIVSYGYANISSLNTLEALLTIVGYTIQIYYDFSGYCDMAIGIGRMFNIQLPVNFNSPYKALTIPQFWKRWHITLTRFLTKYIYIPLGGSRRGTFLTYRNILLTFFISGLWHGAGYTFLLWGLLHGIANALGRAFENQLAAIPRPLLWCFNFGFINLSWVFFRAESISQGLALISRIFAGGFMVNDSLNFQLTQMMLVDIPYRYIPFRFVLVGYTAITLAFTVFGKNTQQILSEKRRGLLPLCLVMLLLSVLSLSGVSTFLYFNF